jgi:glutamate-ammonia-ligase adenylyltransferase
MLDVEFVVQFLQLLSAHLVPDVLDQNTQSAIGKLRANGVLSVEDADMLAPAHRLYQVVTQILRLSVDGPFYPDAAPKGLASLLCRAADTPNLERLALALREAQQAVLRVFEKLLA